MADETLMITISEEVLAEIRNYRTAGKSDKPSWKRMGDRGARQAGI